MRAFLRHLLLTGVWLLVIPVVIVCKLAWLISAWALWLANMAEDWIAAEFSDVD